MDDKLKKLLETSPEELASLQHDELKAHTLKVLRNMTELIEDGKYKEAEDCTFFSPAGDDMGMDNHCIQFAYDADQYRDIGEMLERLQALASQAKKSGRRWPPFDGGFGR